MSGQAGAITPRDGGGQLRWNFGGWAGSVLGMSCWMVLAAALALAEQAWGLAAGLAACAALVIGAGVVLWRARARVAPLPAVLVLLAAAFVSAAAALAMMSGTPEVARVQGQLEGWPWWLAIFPGLAILLVVIDRKGRTDRS